MRARGWMRLVPALCVWALLWAGSAPARAEGLDLDRGMDRLAQGLVKDLAPGRVDKVAVLDPQGPGRGLTALSVLVVEELNSRLAEAKGTVSAKAEEGSGRHYLGRVVGWFKKRRQAKVFKAVLERRRLYEIIVQQRMELSTHFDRDTVSPLGRKMGVDALVFTTIRDLGDRLEVHSSLVGVEKGDIICGSKVEIAKDQRVMRLLSQRPTAQVRVRIPPRLIGAWVRLDDMSREPRAGQVVFRKVAQGLHTLVVGAPCHQDYTLRFYLAGDRELKVEPEPLRTPLYLVVNPPRAKVVIDGRHQVELDQAGAGSLELAAGMHTITATAPGKPLFTRRVWLCDSSLTVPVDLKRGKVELTVRVSPPRARASLDGAPIPLDDQGRWKGEVYPGPHTLAAFAPHHRAASLPLNLERSSQARLSLTPLRYPLTIAFQPAGARLELDGKPLAVQGGEARLEVAAGKHLLRVTAPCHRPYQAELRVQGPTRHELRLEQDPLRVDFGVVYEDPEGRVRALEPGGVLTSDDNYAISFRASGPAYIYIFQVDSSGQVFRLFPNPTYSPEHNPVRPGLTHWLPPRDHWLFLDQTVGRECIYLIFSCRPDRELEELHQRLNNAVGQTAKDDAGRRLLAAIKTRGPAPMTRPGRRRVVKQGSRVFEVVEKTLKAAGGQGVYSLCFRHR